MLCQGESIKNQPENRNIRYKNEKEKQIIKKYKNSSRDQLQHLASPNCNPSDVSITTWVTYQLQPGCIRSGVLNGNNEEETIFLTSGHMTTVLQPCYSPQVINKKHLYV
jgi:hypothetical protein